VQSGACLAPDVAEPERPRVRVCRGEDLPAPTPKPAPAATWEELPPLRAITELPPARRGGVLTVGEIEAMRRPDASPYLPAGDAEAEEPTLAERLLRAVVRRWDFADGKAHGVILEEELQRLGLSEASRLRADVAAMLDWFAATETCRELAKASCCLRDVEY